MFRRYIFYQQPYAFTNGEDISKRRRSQLNLANLRKFTKHLRQKLAQEDSPMMVNEVELVQKFWLKLKPTVKTKIVSELFFIMFEEHPLMQMAWPFGRELLQSEKKCPIAGNTDNNNESCNDKAVKLQCMQHFRFHVINVESALSLLFDNLDKPMRVHALMEKVGSRHFYYGAAEEYFDIMTQAFLTSVERNAPLDSEPDSGSLLLNCMRQSFFLLKRGMQEGLYKERLCYMEFALSDSEMVPIQNLWRQLTTENTKTELGLAWIKHSLEAYAQLRSSLALNDTSSWMESIQKSINQSIKSTNCVSGDDNRLTNKINRFAEETVKALELVMENTPQNVLTLPQLLKDYVSRYYLEQVSPYVIRKALLHGLISMLVQFAGEKSMNFYLKSIWTKLFRILVQATVLCVSSYSNTPSST